MAGKKLSRRAALLRILTYNSLEPILNTDIALCPLLHCCMGLPRYEFDMLADITRLKFHHMGIYFDNEFAKSYTLAKKRDSIEANRRAKIILGIYRPPWDKIYIFSRAEYKIDRTTPITYWYVTNFPSGWSYEVLNVRIKLMYMYGFQSLEVLSYVEKLYNVTANQVTCPLQALRFTDYIQHLPHEKYEQCTIPDQLFIRLLQIMPSTLISRCVEIALVNAHRSKNANVYQKQLLYIAAYRGLSVRPGIRRSLISYDVHDLIKKHNYTVSEFNLVNSAILQPLLRRCEN